MTKTVAILGAGPVGLAAAAHVLDRGMHPLILEQGDKVPATQAQALCLLHLGGPVSVRESIEKLQR